MRALLDDVAAGTLHADAALDALALEPIESLGFATIDHHRSLRQGHPEVIFAPGKTVDQTVTIAEHIAARGDGFLVTRADPDKRVALAARFVDAEINDLARTVYLAPLTPVQPGTGTVAVVTAGTADLPVAEEAAVTLRAAGDAAVRVTDVGVAGIHRLLRQKERERS